MVSSLRCTDWRIRKSPYRRSGSMRQPRYLWRRQSKVRTDRWWLIRCRAPPACSMVFVEAVYLRVTDRCPDSRSRCHCPIRRMQTSHPWRPQLRFEQSRAAPARTVEAIGVDVARLQPGRGCAPCRIHRHARATCETTASRPHPGADPTDRRVINSHSKGIGAGPAWHRIRHGHERAIYRSGNSVPRHILQGRRYPRPRPSCSSRR